METLRIQVRNCLACDEAIDEFHHTWCFVDETRMHRVHADCAEQWRVLQALTDEADGDDPFVTAGEWVS